MSHDLQRAAIDREFAGEPLDAETAAHVETCDQCKAYRERLLHVDSALTGGAMGQDRQDALEARLFAKLGVAKPAVTPVPSRRGVLFGGLVAALAAVVLVVMLRPPVETEFTPRGTKAESFGLRAFCVENGKVVGEARENQALQCGAGQVVQLSYTAAEAAELSISLDSQDVVFGPSPVAAGVDVPLPFSTPVGDWLRRPRVVKWRFIGDAGTEGTLTLMPR